LVLPRCPLVRSKLLTNAGNEETAAQGAPASRPVQDDEAGVPVRAGF